MPATAERCPNCGAPLTLDARLACAFCHTPLTVTPAAEPAAAPPVRVDPSGPFSMYIEDVFSIRGRGTVLTGKVASGVIHVGDHLVLDDGRKVTCAGIEMFRKTLKTANPGDAVGLLISGEGKAAVGRASWIRAAG